MVLQILTSFIYSLVEHSWTVSTVLTKYFIAFIIFKTFQGDERNLKSFSDKLIDYSDIFVTSVVLLGAANIFIGLEITPFVRVFSEIVALGYFGFLFWKY